MKTVHELTLCRAVVAQAGRLAAAHGARGISRIRLAIGPLAGVEIALLHRAFPLCRRGTLAADARLEIEELPLRVRCERCGAVGDAELNRLRCRACGDWHTQLVSGDELLLKDVELVVAAPAEMGDVH